MTVQTCEKFNRKRCPCPVLDRHADLVRSPDAFDRLPVASLLVCVLTGVVVWASSRANERFARDVTGTRLTELVAPGDRLTIDATLARFAEGSRQTEHLPTEIVADEGSVAHYVWLIPLVDPAGRAALVTMTPVAPDGRNVASPAAAQILDRALIAVITDEDGTIMWASRGTAARLGPALAEPVGLLEYSRESLTEQSRADVGRILADLTRSGKRSAISGPLDATSPHGDPRRFILGAEVISEPPGPWRVLWLVLPLPEGAGLPSASKSQQDRRLAHLEAALRDIASELRRVGIGVGDASQPRVAALERLAQLTQRQQQVVDLLARGYRVPEIAERLGLSQGTVRNVLSSVYRKVGVSSQAELVELALSIRVPPAGR